jgi:AraC-like DNA-binding protein
MRIDLDVSDYGVGVFDSAYTFPDVTITVERMVVTYELEFFEENCGITYVNAEPYKLKSGSVLCARPGDVRYTELPLKAYYVKLSPAVTSLTSLLDGLPRFFSLADVTPFIYTVKQMMVTESPLIRHSLLLSLIARLLDEAEKWKRLEQIPLKKNREAIDLGIDYMEKHFSEKCTLEDIAAHAHFSPIYFHGIFKLATGKTPYEYLLSVRLEEAKRLLLTESAPMTEIAAKCGFTGQSYFNYVFKKETGETPSAYRRKMLEEYLKEDGKFEV